MAKRVTNHNGRKGKSGTFSANHVDRNLKKIPNHIDAEKVKDNFKWHLGIDKYPDMTFEEVEAIAYHALFQDGLDAQNERHRKKGNYNRVKTMDQYRQNSKTCPEETLYYVGNRKDSVDSELLKKILLKQIKWEEKTFPNVRYVSYSLHTDEPKSAPHMECRKVWVAHDKDGNLIVNESKALQEMGIEAPFPEKKTGRYNNPKITYTKMVRKHLIELCKSYGLEIIEEPKEKSDVGLSLAEYKAREIVNDAEREAFVIEANAEEYARVVCEMAEEDAQKEKDKAEQYVQDIMDQADDELISAKRSRKLAEKAQKQAEKAAEEIIQKNTQQSADILSQIQLMFQHLLTRAERMKIAKWSEQIDSMQESNDFSLYSR